MPDTPPVTPPDPAGWLHARVAELEADNARLRQAAADRDELAAAQLAARDAQIDALAALVEELQRLLGKDSSTSSRPPSSDSPYKKKPKDRSLRGRSGRRPGKQPGAQSSTLKQSDSPDNTVKCGPAACGCCGHDLADVPAAWLQKRQVFEAAPPPPPVVTEYQVLAKECPACGETSIGLAPAGVTGRVQYGPWVHASTALATCANYLPVARAAKLVAALTGVSVSAGFTATIRGKAAARLGPFMDRVRELLLRPGCCTPTRPPPVSPGTCIMSMWPAPGSSPRCTPGTGPRSYRRRRHPPGYAGTIVRDGYKGYEHLTERCTPGAARTDSGTWPGGTASTPTGSCGPAPWPTR